MTIAAFFGGLAMGGGVACLVALALRGAEHEIAALRRDIAVHSAIADHWHRAAIEQRRLRHQESRPAVMTWTDVLAVADTLDAIRSLKEVER